MSFLLSSSCHHNEAIHTILEHTGQKSRIKVSFHTAYHFEAQNVFLQRTERQVVHVLKDCRSSSFSVICQVVECSFSGVRTSSHGYPFLPNEI